MTNTLDSYKILLSTEARLISCRFANWAELHPLASLSQTPIGLSMTFCTGAVQTSQALCTPGCGWGQRAGRAQDCSCGHPWAPREQPCGAWTTPGLHLPDASSTCQLGDQGASRHRPGPLVTSRGPRQHGASVLVPPSTRLPAARSHLSPEQIPAPASEPQCPDVVGELQVHLTSCT